MLNHLAKCTSHHLLLFTLHSPFSSATHGSSSVSTATAPLVVKTEARGVLRMRCGARRRVIYDDNDEEEGEEEYGYNEEIALLETYTQLMKDEVLLVQAMVDEETVEVVIFKGFSSCLSHETSSDPTRSVLPKKAMIKSIDRIRGPFNPSDIQIIEKGLTFDSFKNRLRTNSHVEGL